MGDFYPKFKVAAVQAAPVYLDREATVKKACELIEEAGAEDAKIVGFSECFVPAFPHWVYQVKPSRGLLQEFYLRLFKNSVVVPSKATETLCNAARENDCYVVMGINEKISGSMGTIYNTMLFIDDNGEILGRHRKLVPTFGERLVHSPSDGTSLDVFDTVYGKLGGLICGEHGNPLAKYTLLAKGESIHVASWPAFMCDWGGDYILQQYSDEGNLFIISSSDYISEEFKELLGKDGEDARTGGGSSGIYGPRGKILAKASPDREEIIYAEVNMEDVIRSKMMRDIVGHYNRFDIFKLYVNEEKQRPLYLKSFDEANMIIPKLKEKKLDRIGEVTERKESCT